MKRGQVMAILIVYWTSSGNTGLMADAVKEGILAEGEKVDLRMVSDIDAEEAAQYEKIALGCPSMGVEQLEEYEFEPFFNNLKPYLANKKVILFGSFSWGDGAWMRTWEEDVNAAGAILVSKGLIVNETPDSDGLEAARALGRALVKA